MDLRYLNKEESELMEYNLALSGLKKTVLADLIGCSYGYLSAMINGRKKISVDNIKNIEFVLGKYIALYKELSENNKKDASKNRVKDKYQSLFTDLDSASSFYDLSPIIMSVDDDYLREKLNNSLSFGLDSNMTVSMLSGCLKNIFYCYG